MKAHIWKDRASGRWVYLLDGFAGDCATWERALAEVLDELDVLRSMRMQA
ncbi:MAG TPA: hypothetical protein VGH54_28950 [Mycobacterium sp.]|jgi:hypothetical protein